MSFPNVWHHRKVADASAKGCDICYKQSTSVLITPEKQDFFYVCPVHLKDTRFCTPIIDHEAIAAKKKKEIDEELERVKKEYMENKRKKEKEKEKEDEKDKGKDKGKEKEMESRTDDDKKDESKSKDKEDKKETSYSPQEEEPRIFALQKNFYQQRVDKKRQAEMAKRNRERLNNPNLFPSVPKGAPGS